MKRGECADGPPACLQDIWWRFITWVNPPSPWPTPSALLLRRAGGGGYGGWRLRAAGWGRASVSCGSYQRCSLLSVHLQPPPMTSFSYEANGDFLLMDELVRCPNRSSWGLPRYLHACVPRLRTGGGASCLVDGKSSSVASTGRDGGGAGSLGFNLYVCEPPENQ